MLRMAKKKPQRSRDLGRTRYIGAEVDPRLDDALEALAGRRRQTKRVVIITAMEELLTREGLWPPSSDAVPASDD